MAEPLILRLVKNQNLIFFDNVPVNFKVFFFTGDHSNNCGMRFLHPLVSVKLISWAIMQNVGHPEIHPFKMAPIE